MTYPENGRLGELNIMGALLFLVLTCVGCMDDTPVSPPVVTRDMNATESYTLTLSVGEGGDFDLIEAQSAYSITNGKCVPMDHSIALGGVRNLPLEKMDLPVTQVGERKFRTEALQRPFFDQDHYGLGTCRWAIEWIRFYIHRADHVQSVVMTLAEIRNQQTKVAFCFRDPPRNGAGCSDPSSVKAGIRHLFFKATIQSHNGEKGFGTSGSG